MTGDDRAGIGCLGAVYFVCCPLTTWWAARYSDVPNEVATPILIGAALHFAALGATCVALIFRK